MPHPDFVSTAVTEIAVSADLLGSALSLQYRLSGAMDRVAWPRPIEPSRADNLWQRTCFEAFVGHPQEGYFEYNFSPSGQWATYFFDWYRDGMRPATWLSEPTIHVVQPDMFCLTAKIDLTDHWTSGDRCLGLSAVIEETDGTKSYWALAHAPGPPDFHNRDCFTATLPAPDPS